MQESTFEQEPGSGAKAIVEGKLVTVGTLEWLKRSVTSASPLSLVFLSKVHVYYLMLQSFHSAV